MAHALTALRTVLAVPFAWLMSRGDPASTWLAAGALVLAIASDLLDGPVARRTGRASSVGRAFDHSADFLFVTGGLLGGAARGAFPLALPVLVIAAFAQYVIDSYWLHRERELRMSSLGRWNGILYFVPVCADLLLRTGALAWLRLDFAAPLVWWICWALVVTTVLSIADRALALSRTAPDSRGGGTGGRWPR